MKCFILLFHLGFLLKATLSREICRAELNTEPNIFKFIGQPIYFTCSGWRPGDVVTVNFHFNDTVYINESYRNTWTTKSQNNVAFYLRVFSSPLALNNTYVSCSVQDKTKNCSESSSKSRILLQGLLSEVPNLDVRLDFTCSINGSILINWSQPFSFIPEGGAGITYRVVVASSMSEQEFNTSATSSMVLLPNNDPNRSSCISFNISLVPINTVGSGMTAITMKSVLSTADTINITGVVGHYINRNYIVFKVHIEPSVCNITMTLTDIYTGTNIQLPLNNLELTNNCSYGSLVTIHTSETTIRENSRYNATYFFTNSGGTTISHILSTFDVQSMNIENNTQIRLNIVFLENSSAAGALLLFRSPESDTIHFITMDRDEYNLNNFTSMESTIILSVYDIEENGELMSGVNKPAILPQKETFLPCSTSECIENKPTNIQLCSKHSIEKTIMLTCTCTESNRYQVLLLYHTDLDGIIYANSTVCSNMVAISVKDFGVYHVTVFYVDNKKGMTGFRARYLGNISVTNATINEVTTIYTQPEPTNPISTIIGAVVGAIVVVVLAVIFIVVVCKYAEGKKRNIQMEYQNRLQCTNAAVQYQNQLQDMNEASNDEEQPQNQLNVMNEANNEEEQPQIKLHIMNEANDEEEQPQIKLHIMNEANNEEEQPQIQLHAINEANDEEKQPQIQVQDMDGAKNDEEDQGTPQPVHKAEAKDVKEEKSQVAPEKVNEASKEQGSTSNMFASLTVPIRRPPKKSSTASNDTGYGSNRNSSMSNSDPATDKCSKDQCMNENF